MFLKRKTRQKFFYDFSLLCERVLYICHINIEIMKPEPKQKFINVPVKPEDKIRLTQQAKENKTTVAAMVRKQLGLLTPVILLCLFTGLTSCSAEQADCHCDAEYTTGTGNYFVNGMPIECDTKQPLAASKSGGYFVGCK